MEPCRFSCWVAPCPPPLGTDIAARSRCPPATPWCTWVCPCEQPTRTAASLRGEHGKPPARGNARRNQRPSLDLCIARQERSIVQPRQRARGARIGQPRRVRSLACFRRRAHTRDDLWRSHRMGSSSFDPFGAQLSSADEKLRTAVLTLTPPPVIAFAKMRGVAVGARATI